MNETHEVKAALDIAHHLLKHGATFDMQEIRVQRLALLGPRHDCPLLGSIGSMTQTIFDNCKNL